MQYMLLIYEAEDAFEGEAGEALLADVVARHMALAEELQASGVQLGGAGLQPSLTATTLRTSPAGDQSLHDGPFAETREHLGGFYLVDVPDLDAALAIARRIPCTPGGGIEVRPTIEA